MGLQNLIDNCPAGENILVYDVSRFCRRKETGLKIWRQLEERSVVLHFVKEGISSNICGFETELIKHLDAAEHELVKLTSRISDSRHHLKARGSVFGCTPFGKRSVFVSLPDTHLRLRKLETDPFESKILQLIQTLRTTRTKVAHVLASLQRLTEQESLELRIQTTTIKSWDERRLTYDEIADLLNSVQLWHRGKPWTPASVRSRFTTRK